LKWSFVAFALLLPFVIHSVWDYIETRRLRAFIDEIVRKGEPVRPDTYRPLTGDAAESDRYYRAAAALASGFGLEMSAGAGPSQFGFRVTRAESEGLWPDDLVRELRTVLDRYRDALTFGDRAASLPFEGFGPLAYSELTPYLTGQLFNVQRLSHLRSELLALDGDGDGALDSYYTTARLTRALGDSFGPLSAVRGASDLQRVLERTRPSPGGLERVSGAVAELDRDDVTTRWLANLRALVIQGASRLGVTPELSQRSTHLEDVIARPWNGHVLNRQLEVFSRLLLAAQAPWPERIDRVVAVGEWPIRYGNSPMDVPSFLHSDMVRQAQVVAIVRSTRVVVAMERYRRGHGEQLPARPEALVPDYLPAVPIDPFSGQPLIVANEARGYVVYSIGANRRDDGGRDVSEGFASVPAWSRATYTADTGIRIQYR
jgi:hypothetical protein